MITIRQFLSDQTVFALGWTLIHSLWQITLISFLLYGLLGLFRNKPANSRYIAIAVSFFIILITSVTSFITVYNHYQPAGHITQTTEPGFVKNLVTDPAITTTFGLLAWIKDAFAMVENLKIWIEGNLSIIVLFWIAGLMALSIRLTGNLVFLQRLRKSGNTSLSDEWQIVITSLSRKIGINRSIQAFESTMAKVPMVIGHFKPVILIPAGLIFSVPPDQIEAILAHELAHIRRKDFLINTLKSVIEAVYFYHPAIWWLSSVFNQERENCCDDITIKASIKPLSLTKALVNAEEFRMTSPRLVMAFYQKHYKLLKRIKRMNTKKNQAQKTSARSIALLIILAVMVGFAAKSSISIYGERYIPHSSSLSSGSDLLNVETEKPVSISSDPSIQNPEDDNTIVLVKEGKEYKAVFDGVPGKIALTGFWADGKEIPQSKWADYELVIKEMKQKYNQYHKQAQSQTSTLKSEYKATVQEARMIKDEAGMMKKTIVEKKGELNTEEKMQLTAIFKGVEMTQKNLEMLKAEYLENAEQKKLEAEQIAKAKQLLAVESQNLEKLKAQMNAIYVMEQGLLDQERAEYKELQEQKLKEQQLAMEAKEQAAQLEKIEKVFYKNLLEDGVLKEGDQMSLILSYEKMVVNEKEQPENTRKKYLQLYQKLHGAPLSQDQCFAIDHKI